MILPWRVIIIIGSTSLTFSGINVIFVIKPLPLHPPEANTWKWYTIQKKELIESHRSDDSNVKFVSRHLVAKWIWMCTWRVTVRPEAYSAKTMKPKSVPFALKLSPKIPSTIWRPTRKAWRCTSAKCVMQNSINLKVYAPIWAITQVSRILFAASVQKLLAYPHDWQSICEYTLERKGKREIDREEINPKIKIHSTDSFVKFVNAPSPTVQHCIGIERFTPQRRITYVKYAARHSLSHRVYNFICEYTQVN